jgi:glycosyltransferase involved in cell wall biosynthesis
LVDRLCHEGIRVVEVGSLTRTPHVRRDIEALRVLVRLMHEGDFGLVHCHSTKAGFLGRIAARLAGVPAVVFTSHGWQFVGEWPSWLRLAMLTAEWMTAWLSTAIICVSKYDRQVAIAHHIGRPDKLFVVQNGVDPTPWVASGDSHHKPADASCPRTAVMVGRLAPPKDPVMLLEAWRRVPGNHRLILVGDGPLRVDVETAIRREALRDRVEVLPPTTDIPALMRTAHVFVMSSRWEGLPLAIIEAMMSGLPVVATKVGGVPEIVSENETGLLVPTGDPEALAAALKRILDEPSLAYRMGQAGRRRALARFTEARMLAETNALYARVLAGRVRTSVGAPQ